MKVISALTESGTVYSISPEQKKVIRYSASSAPMRRDHEALEYYNEPIVTVGLPLSFALEPLGDGNVTYRTTSPVVYYEENEIY